MTAALVRNARLRDEGTRNLIAAAMHSGAKRLIAQSISFIYEDGPIPHQESDPLLPVTHPVYGETVQGVMSLEHQVMEAPLDGIVLRYGLLYAGDWTGWDFSQETFGHKGSTGTFLWIDPQRELLIVLLNNRVQSKHPDRRAPARHHGVYCARSYRTSYERGADRTFIGEVRR